MRGGSGAVARLLRRTHLPACVGGSPVAGEALFSKGAGRSTRELLLREGARHVPPLVVFVVFFPGVWNGINQRKRGSSESLSNKWESESDAISLLDSVAMRDFFDVVLDFHPSGRCFPTTLSSMQAKFNQCRIFRR